MNVPAPSDLAQQDPPISAPGYAVAPNAVLRDARLSPQARLLYVLLDGHAGKSGRVRVGDAVVAAELGVSERSLYRYLAELQAAELVTRKGTGRSAITVIHNGIRARSGGGRNVEQATIPQARTVTAGSAELTPVAALQRSNSREVINSNAGDTAKGSSAPAPTRTHAADGPAGRLLDAVREATGAPVEMVPRVRRDLEKIAARGVTPAELAVEVAAWMAVKGAEVIRPAGFIAGIVLPAIAQGSEVPAAELPSETPIPPPFRPEPVAHGDAAAGIAAARAALAATSRQETPA